MTGRFFARGWVTTFLVVAAGPCARAAVVTTISPGDMPAGAPMVMFEGLLRWGVSPTYSEAGVYLPSPTQGWTRPGDSTNLVNGSPKNPIIFPYPVERVSWTEWFDTLEAVTLYADAGGTQSIGTFDITIPRPSDAGRFHGFASDTPFERMELGQVPPSFTIMIDDLQFAPEPGAGGVLVVGAGCWYLGRRRGRRAAPVASTR